MGDGEEKGDSKCDDDHVETPIVHLEDWLWTAVTDGKIKRLHKFFHEYADHSKLHTVLNASNEDYDDDGGNIVVYAVKASRGRNRGHLGCLRILVERGADVNASDKAMRSALCVAVDRKYSHAVKLLVELGARADVCNQDDVTPFHCAVAAGYTEMVLLFLEKGDKELVNLPDGKGVPPLVTAVKHGHLSICRLLLEHAADVNASEMKTGCTAVHHSITGKHPDILDLLLRYHPNLHTIDTDNRSLLHICSKSSDVRCYHKVIRECPDLCATAMDQRDSEGKTALILACQHGNAEQLKNLIEQGASVRATDDTDKTALHYCADNLETQCAEMVLDKDPTVLDMQDDQGYTATALAVLAGNMNLLKLLLERGADTDCVDHEGHKLAHWAAVCGHLKILDTLKQHKCDFASCDNHQAYPIHYAAQMNGQNSGISDTKIAEKVLKKVIECNVQLDVTDDAGRQPLLWAACSGNTESCKLLIKAGAAIDAVDKDELTALHCAASRGHTDCIEVLRKNSANPNMTDRNKCTPLFYAITLGNKDCTRALLAAKADPNHVDERGRNPAHCAAIKGCLDTIKLLEKEKANLWHQNKKGDYPIHEAAQKGHIDVVKYLLRVRNDKDAVNVQNHAGKSLLHIASATNNLPLCKILINQDCDKNALMKHADKEFTPYDLAVVKGHKDTADYLKAKGALPYSDLKNVQKRPSRSARARKTTKANGIDPVAETKESPDKSKKDVVLTAVDKDKRRTPSPTKVGSPSKGRASPGRGKTPDRTDGSEVTKGAAAGTAGVVINDNDKDAQEKDKVKTEAETTRAKSKSPELKTSPIKRKESPEKSDKLVGIDKSTVGVMTVESKKDETDKSKNVDTTKETVDLDKDKLQQKSGVGASEAKDDETRASKTDLKEGSPNRNASTQKGPIDVKDKATATMGSKSSKPKTDEGKLGDLQTDPTKGKISEKQRKSKRRNVGFESGDEDSGHETDPSYRKKKRPAKNNKQFIDSVRRSVRQYQGARNASRQLHQLKRAQIHTGPMHDIVMFSKMMDSYRRGLDPSEEEEVRNHANWEGYLNDQLRFLSHLSDDGSKTPQDIKDTAKGEDETVVPITNPNPSPATKSIVTSKSVQEAKPKHKSLAQLAQLKALLAKPVVAARAPRQPVEKEHQEMLATEAGSRKRDTEIRCNLLNEDQQRQRRTQQQMDYEIDKLAKKTEDMFNNITDGASTTLHSARSRNSQMKTNMKQSRDEHIKTSDDPKEKELLLKQQTFEEWTEKQDEAERERKEKHKSWQKRKSDEEMRRKLIQAYRPYFPNDVFSPRTVCVSGGRVKSAGRMRVDSSQLSVRRPLPSPRPSSTKSDYSVAQYKLREDSTKVQMTPFGLRRVRSQERPTYASWSRKYDGNIRPRTGLVFVEPRVYDDLVREEMEAKRRISSEARNQFGDGDLIDAAEFPNGDRSDSVQS